MKVHMGQRLVGGLLLWILCGYCAGIVEATSAGPKATRTRGPKVSYLPKEGLKLDLMGDGNWLFWLRGDVFARPEFQTNRGDYDSARDDSDLYVVARVRMTLRARLYRHVGFQLALQEASYWGNGLRDGGKIRFNRETNSQFHRELFLGTTLFEGYLFIEQPWLWPMRLELGRLKLVYGDSFFIGDPAFIPQGQSFDAIRLRLSPGDFQIDLMWLKVRESVVLTNASNCATGCLFEGDDLGGVYATYKGFRHQEIDLYGYFWQLAPRDTDDLLEASQIAIIGARYQFKNRLIFATAEVIVQVGRHRRKTLQAFANRLYFKFNFGGRFRPYLGFQYMMASGDGDPSDQVDTAFLPVYSNRRKFYGLVNLFGPSNILQPTLLMGISPHPTLLLHFDFRHTWMWDPRGALVNGGSHSPTVQDPSGNAGNIIGMEADLLIRWKPFPFITLDASGGLFFPTPGGFFPGLRANGGTEYGVDFALMVFFNARLKF